MSMVCLLKLVLNDNIPVGIYILAQNVGTERSDLLFIANHHQIHSDSFAEDFNIIWFSEATMNYGPHDEGPNFYHTTTLSTISCCSEAVRRR